MLEKRGYMSKKVLQLTPSAFEQTHLCADTLHFAIQINNSGGIRLLSPAGRILHMQMELSKYGLTHRAYTETIRDTGRSSDVPGTR